MSQDAIPTPIRYDRVTISFHWLTVLLVAALLGTSFAWKYLPRGWHLRSLEDIHVSLGICLAAVLVARLIWRVTGGQKLVEEGNALSSTLSRLVHWALYGLLVLQVALGFGLRWLQDETFSFFGLFSIPRLFAANEGLADQIGELHELTAWALILVAGGHAGAALFHRYVLKDGVLKRMTPTGRRSR